MSQTPFAARCSIMLLHQVRAHSMPPNKLRRRRGRGRCFGRRANGAAQHISIGRYTPKSDRLLRCREMSLWANRDQSASQQFSEAKIALGIGGVRR